MDLLNQEISVYFKLSCPTTFLKAHPIGPVRRSRAAAVGRVGAVQRHFPGRGARGSPAAQLVHILAGDPGLLGGGGGGVLVKDQGHQGRGLGPVILGGQDEKSNVDL